MTSRTHEHRHSTRLHIDHGLVLLRNGTHPAIACALTDLSEGGCHCNAVPGTIEAMTFADWKTVVKPGTSLSVELSRPPFFMRLRIDAAIAHIDTLNDSSMELGIVFKNVEPAVKKALEHALFSIATEKIRHFTAEKPVTTDKNSADPASEQSNAEPLAHRTLTEILLRLNLLTMDALSKAELNAKTHKMPLVRYLLKEHLVKPADMCRAISLSASLPVTDLSGTDLSGKELLGLFSYLTMLRYEFVPFSMSKELLCIAAIAPLSVETLNELTRHCGREILVFIAPADQIRKQLFRMRPRSPFRDREKMRIRARATADFELANAAGINMDDDHHHGQTIDVSESGFLLEAPVLEKYTVEQLLETEHFMRVALHCDEQIIHAFCKIRHIEPLSARESRRPLWHIGLQITSIEPDDATKLRNACVRTADAQMATRKKGF